jgi:hypothetical protein
MSDPRRKTKRYQARWKAALAFDSTTNKPIFHTQTHDLSMNGTSVQSHADEALNTLLTVLLVPPVLEGIPQKIFRPKAVVVSSRPYRNGFRLGLNFIPDNELTKLRGVLEGLDLSGESLPSEPGETAPRTGVAAVATSEQGDKETAAPAMSVLDVLKQKNLSKKLTEEQLAKDRLERQRILNKRISDALVSAYRYFIELTEQLNSLKPVYSKPYPLLGVTELTGLVWQDTARTNCFTRKPETEYNKIFDKVTLEYSYANREEVQVVREYHVHEMTKRMLEEDGILFRMTLEKNNRGLLDKAVFSIPSDVKAKLVFSCNDESGKLLLSAHNVERFGIVKFEFDIETLNQALLDQLTLMILGEGHSVGKLIGLAKL